MLRDLLAAAERGEVSPETLNRFLTPQEAELTADFTPVVGDVKALAYDLPQNLQKGDYGWAAVDALSALPVVGMLGDAAKAGRKGIKAYHGSPADFDKFSDEFIGTGEGAQAYGYGHYLAENPQVGKSYRDKLSPRKPVDEADVSFDVENYFGDDIAEHAADRAEYMSQGDKGVYYHFDDGSRGYIDDAGEFIAEGVPQGKFYEVSVDADLGELLDWDKPFNQQPEYVQKKLRENLPKEVRSRIAAAQQSFGAEKVKGGDIINSILADHYGSQKKVSKALNDMGIKGIKYSDGASRAAEGGTKNYVVFDPEIIKIATKLGVSLTVAAGIYERNQQRQEELPRGS